MPEGERSKRVVNELQVVTSANQAVVKVRDEDIESVGTFNDWDGGKHPMQAEGTATGTLTLPRLISAISTATC
jgi:hypothetical protein